MPVRLPNAATQRLLDLIEAIRQLAEGRGNAGGIVTLTPNATSTTVTGSVIGRDGAISLIPVTPTAVAVPWHIPVATQTTGQFVVQHDSNPATDRTFRWSQANG